MPKSAMIRETAIGRRRVRVPADQSELLERREAWREILQKDPHGLLNIPPEVLEKFLEHHSARLKNQQGAGDNLPESSVATAASQAKPTIPPANSRSASQSDVEESDSAISWSSSPSRDAAPMNEVPCLGLQTSPALSTTVHQLVEPAEPPKPAQIKRPFRPAAFVNNSPSSSVGNSDDELEMQTPIALVGQAHKGMNQVARPVPTPPSAQVIPCSFNESSPQMPNQRKRRRVMKAIRFGSQDDEPQPPQDPTQATTIARPHPVSSAPPHRAQQSGIELTTMSSLSSLGSAQNTIRSLKAPEFANSSSLATDALPIPTVSEPNLVPKELAPAQLKKISPPYQSGQGPYDLYKEAYPCFKGHPGDFLRACLYIDQLEKLRALPVVLYDDFIRAFWQHWVPYVRDADAKQEDIKLTAIEWYYEHLASILYEKGIVTRDFIRRVFEYYPEEIRAIRYEARLDDDSQQGLEPTEDALDAGCREDVQEEAPVLKNDDEPKLDALEDRAPLRKISPELGTPASNSHEPPVTRLLSPKLGTLISRESLETDISTQERDRRTSSPPSIIPNTSVPVLAEKQTVIPEMVRRPICEPIHKPVRTAKFDSDGDVSQPRPSATQISSTISISRSKTGRARKVMTDKERQQYLREFFTQEKLEKERERREADSIRSSHP